MILTVVAVDVTVPANIVNGLSSTTKLSFRNTSLTLNTSPVYVLLLTTANFFFFFFFFYCNIGVAV